MSSSKESRSDATARVTCACAAWLWRQGSRIIASEVGLTRGSLRLIEPWGAWYRVDLAASLGSATHIIEVKGTRADIAREDLGAGKWALAYDNLTPWLAFDDKITPDLYQSLDERWGLMRVKDQRVKVLRRPHRVHDDQRQKNLEVLASVLCMQSLPKMMGLTHAGQLAALETDGFSRPWRRWVPEPRLFEEDGHIL